MPASMSEIEISRQLTEDTPANAVATWDMMRETKHPEQLSPVAQRAWRLLESEFPLWTAHLSARDGEMEFAVPAPSGSTAGHLVAFSNQGELWVRFSPPNMCYPADDENEMISLVKQLTTDEIVFKVVMQGKDWVETTLTKPQDNLESLRGHSVRLISWSGKLDRSC